MILKIILTIFSCHLLIFCSFWILSHLCNNKNAKRKRNILRSVRKDKVVMIHTLQFTLAARVFRVDSAANAHAFSNSDWVRGMMNWPMAGRMQPAMGVRRWDRLAHHGDVWWCLAVQLFARQQTQFVGPNRTSLSVFLSVWLSWISKM